VIHFKNEEEFKQFTGKSNKKTKIHNSRNASAIHKSNQIDDAYKQAVETLHYLQSSGGSLFLADSRFLLWVKAAGKRGRSDGVNIYKGVEDALNKIAYRDDFQNETFRQESPFS